jgi:glutamine amidotransferase
VGDRSDIRPPESGTPAVLVVDYGMGNLFSVTKALEALGARAEVSADPAAVARAERILLPGVGAFGEAMKRLDAAGLSEALREARRRGAPLFGVCLGLQLLFESSEESPGVRGLGLLRGAVRRFRAGLKVPHMGWNRVSPRAGSAPFAGIPDGAFFYFVHSFHVTPDDARDVAATSDYGGVFCAAVERGTTWGAQFHPEKSRDAGLRVLANFLALPVPAGAGKRGGRD